VIQNLAKTAPAVFVVLAQRAEFRCAMGVVYAEGMPSFPRFGVNDLRQWWLGSPNLPAGYPVQAHRNLVTNDLNDLANHGLSVRVDFIASDMDANGDGVVENWTFPDALFKTFSQRGVTPLVLLRSNNLPTTDAQRLAFANGTTARVDRFTAGGSFWAANPTLRPVPFDVLELWNEANLASYFNGTPQQYGLLLAKVRERVNASTPDFRFVTAGLAETSSNGQRPGPWLTTALVTAAASSGLGKYHNIAGVGLHTYGAPTWTPAQAAVNFDQFVADLLAANGSYPPVWVTEFGWRVSPTNVTGNNAYDQSDMLGRYRTLVTELLKRGSGPIFAYNYRMGRANWDPGNLDDSFGFYKTIGTLDGADTTQANNGQASPAGAWFLDLGKTDF
jgi:hypothetical protein